MNLQIGSGLITPNGFSALSGTGYKLRNDNRGCQGVWGGLFYDTFGYVSSAGGHDTTFNPYYTAVPDSGATYLVQTFGDGYILGNQVPFFLYPRCASFPNLGDQFSQVTLVQNGTTGSPTSGTPLFGGGVAAFLKMVSGTLHGYYVDGVNSFFSGSDFRHTFYIRLHVLNGAGDFELAHAALLTGGTGFNSSGWYTSPAPLAITVQPGVSSNYIQVFLGDKNVPADMLFDYTDSSGSMLYNTGKPGLYPSVLSQLFLCGEL